MRTRRGGSHGQGQERAAGQAASQPHSDFAAGAQTVSPHLPPLAGVRLATGAAGIRYKDRTDVLLAVLAPGTQVAGRLHQIQDRLRAGGVVPRHS